MSNQPQASLAPYGVTLLRVQALLGPGKLAADTAVVAKAPALTKLVD